MAYKDMSSLHTMAELRQRMDPNGMLANIAEAQDEVNELAPDMLWQPANDKTSHLYTKRVSLGSPSIRRINQGVTPSKTTTGQDRELIMFTEDWSEIDTLLADLSGDPAGYRLGEEIGFAESFGQAVPGYVFYGTGADEEIQGLANRLNDTALENVSDAGGTGSNLTSLYIAMWGPDFYGIYPPGTQAGLFYEDKGVTTIQDSGTRMDAYQSKFQWHFGICSRDDRFIRRIANIDTSDVIGTQAAVDDYLIYQLNKMPRNSRGRGTVIYGNSDALTIFDILAKDKTNVNYGVSNKWGDPVMAFRDMIPIRRIDQILSTEDEVTT